MSEHLTPAERRRWGMFEVVRAALKAGMMPVDQDPGKVAIFERPIQRAPYIAVAIPNFEPQSFLRTFSADFDPTEHTWSRETYECFFVYLGQATTETNPARFYAYATSRDELDRFFERRNAEAARKADPIVRNGKPVLDTWVVGESTALARRGS